jgi:hypothetical protein
MLMIINEILGLSAPTVYLWVTMQVIISPRVIFAIP